MPSPACLKSTYLTLHCLLCTQGRYMSSCYVDVPVPFLWGQRGTELLQQLALSVERPAPMGRLWVQLAKDVQVSCRLLHGWWGGTGGAAWGPLGKTAEVLFAFWGPLSSLQILHSRYSCFPCCMPLVAPHIILTPFFMSPAACLIAGIPVCLCHPPPGKQLYSSHQRAAGCCSPQRKPRECQLRPA